VFSKELVLYSIDYAVKVNAHKVAIMECRNVKRGREKAKP
jgi:hypothetical protein